MNTTNKLKCPQCGAEIDIDEVLIRPLENKLRDKVKSEMEEIEKQLREKIEEDQSERIKSLKVELDEKSGKLKEYHKAKAEIEKLRREKSEMRDELEAENAKKTNELLKQEREKIRKAIDEDNEMKLLEKDQLIDQLKKNLKDAQQKAEQGSMQAQGEVQEVAIEDYLKESFPLDSIEEIKKGARGADCLQIVNTQFTQNCGTI